MTLHERLARQPPGYQFTIGRILAIYSGLMVALLLAALDQTIVATALQVGGGVLIAAGIVLSRRDQPALVQETA